LAAPGGEPACREKRRLGETLLNPRPSLLAATAIIAIGLAGKGAVAAAVPDRAGGPEPGVARGEIRRVDPSFPFRYRLPSGRAVPLQTLARRPRAHRLRLFSGEPQLGEVRFWAGLDIVRGELYPKPYALRGVGRKIEVWVTPDLDYLPADCRNGSRTSVSDAQVQDLIRAFDRRIHPLESAVFSLPPSRDGANALVGPPFQPQGRGDRIVALIDNIRDESYYDLNNSQAFGYVVGLYSSALDRLFDRNMMSIDAFDWLHRTGRRPPHEPAEGDNCRHAPAHPRLIEGVFAHEYQHLLEFHEDADETDWLDEGLAEWARSLTGYARPHRPVSKIGYDRHMQCFLGNVPDLAGGPENSLTLWGDGAELNCDYGAVYSFMEYVHRRYGTRFMTALHRGDANGLAGLQEALGRRAKAEDVLHDWAASLSRSVNWETPHAYQAPGAPPNGADYVRLRDADGEPVRARDVRSLSFEGATEIPGRPVEWVVDAAPPNGGSPALYSGGGNNLDRTIVRSLSVPAGSPELAFQAQWNVEEDPTGGWDFTFVQVSTDGGATYRSIACTSSRSDASPFARPVMHENVPGYTAYSGGWRNERCDLGAFAGRSILLAFRHLTDGSVPGDPDDPAATIPPGFWLRNLTLAGAPVADGSTLSGWLSPSQARPTAVHGFTLLLVGRGRPVEIRLDARHDASLSARQLRHQLGGHADAVGAIVIYDDPTEQVQAYAPYRLTVNGVLQPGG
jgi:hypothetical protein